jgi:hypothetical protein
VSLTPPKNLSPVSLTPPKNLLPVSLTPLNSFFGVVVDTGDKFNAFWFLMTGINDTGENFFAGVVDDRGLLLLQNYLRQPKSATAANIVIGRPRRPPKLLQTKTALFSFGGLRGL